MERVVRYVIDGIGGGKTTIQETVNEEEFRNLVRQEMKKEIRKFVVIKRIEENV